MKEALIIRLVLCFTLISLTAVSGQNEKDTSFKRIEDNSFLLEEAYNQEPVSFNIFRPFSL